MKRPIRISVNNFELAQYYEIGWHYRMPDFDNQDHSIIEWHSLKPPVKPFENIPETQQPQEGR